MNEKLLITGGSGLLGSNIAKMTAKDFEVCATYNSHPSHIPGCDFAPLNIRDEKQVISVFKRKKPKLVIHAAALVNVDYCEDHPKEAWSINVEGTENVALASKEVGAKLVYISTDSVFDGEKGMYTEEDIPHPLNVYAKTKLEGEMIVQRWLPDSIIVRTAFYGWSLHNKLSLAEWVVNELRTGKTLKMFTDVFFSPIYVDNLIEVMVEMYRKGLTGIYHVGGRERCSKYMFGQEIAQAFGLHSSYIQPYAITEAGFKACRPKDLFLDINKVSRAVDKRLLSVKEGIMWFKDCEHTLKEDLKGKG